MAVKRRPEAVGEEPTPEHATRNRVRKTVSKQLSLTALFQLGSEAALIKHRVQSVRRAEKIAAQAQSTRAADGAV